MKKIIQIVVAVHIAFVLVLSLGKTKPKKQTILKMHTIVQAPVKVAAPVQVKAPVKVAAPIKRAPPVKKVPPPKPATRPVAVQKKVEKPRISQALAKELRENLAKIHQKSDKDWPIVALSAPGFVHNLTIDLSSEGSKYEGTLVEKLQGALDLPEIGEVEIQLTLRCDGQFASMQIVKSESSLNSSYLAKQLKLVQFPPFTGELLGAETHTFTLTFCNR